MKCKTCNNFYSTLCLKCRYTTHSDLSPDFYAPSKDGMETENYKAFEKHKEDILQFVCNAYSIPRDLLGTPDIIKCAECGNIIGLSEGQIKKHCLYQENNYRNCLCVSCTQKWKQAQEMANIKPKDLVYFGRKI